ncbi:ubiquitin-like modifier 1 [Fusarium austroafricanum]|uniref:Ubiquitin-related modifier 1 n=1 Tax=Fusarium austroafricanum TaxID=2364996 RepID=A0A8H4NXF8_9HYPO|nr:ubiquitin-like modifier 1 [Fusarium austroafricanum]
MAEPTPSPKLNIVVEFSLDSDSDSDSSPPLSARSNFLLGRSVHLNHACAWIFASNESPFCNLIDLIAFFFFFLVTGLTLWHCSGGLEMLFSNKRQHALAIPAADQGGKPANIAYLIDHLCQNVMDYSRKDLFVLDNHLRPGILVLINDADWELEGEEAYELQGGDNILFVSTLHGG